MKKLILLFLILIFPIMSCSLFKPTIGPSRLIKEMMESNKSDNPAFKELTKQKLINSMLDIESVKVHSIVQYPTDYYLWEQWESITLYLSELKVKYQFCIRSIEKTKDFVIEYRFFSNDIDTISKLKENDSIVDIKGEIHKIEESSFRDKDLRGTVKLIIIEVLATSIEIKETTYELGI